MIYTIISLVIIIILCLLCIRFIKKLLALTDTALTKIEALNTDINTLKSFLDKMHNTMHLIRSIDPLFHKYKVINESLKTEETIHNTMRLDEEDKPKKDISIGKLAESYYINMFSQDNQMKYGGTIKHGNF